MRPIRLLIVDDHPVFCAGLRLLLDGQPDIHVVGAAAHCQEALHLARDLAPDVVTMDLSIPIVGGIKIIERLRREKIPLRVLVLTMHDNPAYLRAALAAGADGYLLKTAGIREVADAIRAVHAGRRVVDPALASEAPTTGPATALPRAAGTDAPIELSQREEEVLVFVAQGHTNQQIADRLFLSVKTVETYRARVGKKLGLRNRADFVRYAIETGRLERV